MFYSLLFATPCVYLGPLSFFYSSSFPENIAFSLYFSVYFCLLQKHPQWQKSFWKSGAIGLCGRSKMYSAFTLHHIILHYMCFRLTHVYFLPSPFPPLPPSVAQVLQPPFFLYFPHSSSQSPKKENPGEKGVNGNKDVERNGRGKRREQWKPVHLMHYAILIIYGFKIYLLNTISTYPLHYCYLSRRFYYFSVQHISVSYYFSLELESRHSKTLCLFVAPPD